MARVRQLSDGLPEYPVWRRWMQAIGGMRETYHRRRDSDPLAISEATTVGLMLSAAGQAGLIGLLEYPTEKAAGEKGWCYGRCDLWLVAPRHADQEGWAFEVKHRRITPRSTARVLVEPFRAAWRDAGALDVAEASMRLACTVLYSDQKIDAGTAAGRTLRKLAGMSDWSWRISHDGGLPPCYVFLKRRRRRNRG